MAARSSNSPATYRDIEALPPNMVGEIVGGVLYANPRPALPHSAAASALARSSGRHQYLEVLRLDGDSYRIVATHVAEAKVRAEPFDAIELDLAVLWAR